MFSFEFFVSCEMLAYNLFFRLSASSDVKGTIVFNYIFCGSRVPVDDIVIPTADARGTASGFVALFRHC